LAFGTSSPSAGSANLRPAPERSWRESVAGANGRWQWMTGADVG
jgi:hypothetical protein